MEKRQEQMSLIELAEFNLSKKKNPQTFQAMCKEIAEIRNISDEDMEELEAQFYTELVISAKFVYCGEDLWDLKSKQKIDDLDKEFYGEHKDILDDYDDEDEFEDDVEVLSDDEDEDEDDDDSFETVSFEDDYDMDDEDIDDEDDDVYYDDEDDFEEDEYNDIMDDYEDLYE